jgi:hypothetical protein
MIEEAASLTITKEVLKAEIDRIEDKYLETVYRIIKTLETTPAAVEHIEWQQFIETTYGSLQDTPIERGDQGEYEVREPLT